MRSTRKFRLYIDEVGTPQNPKKSKALFDNFFGLCGVIVEEVEQEKLRESFSELRKIIDEDKDNHAKIIFHRKDILEKRGCFKVLMDETKQKFFNQSLVDCIKTVKFHTLFCGLDKISHMQKYETPMHPYSYMIIALIERYVDFLEKNSAVGDIIVERRGKQEDILLQEFYENIFLKGVYRIKRVEPEKLKRFLSSKNLKFKDKTDCVSGIELADMLAVPCLFTLLEFLDKKTYRKDTYNYEISNILLEQHKFTINESKIIL